MPPRAAGQAQTCCSEHRLWGLQGRPFLSHQFFAKNSSLDLQPKQSI